MLKTQICVTRPQCVKKWAAESKRGHTGLEDDPREGRPKNATTPDIIEQVHDTSTHVLHIAAVGNTIYKTKVFHLKLIYEGQSKTFPEMWFSTLMVGHTTTLT